MGHARLPSGRRSAAGRNAGAARAGGPAGVVASLSQLAGNRAVGRLLARSPSGAPPITDRTRIDQVAGMTGVKPVDRCRYYAEIAGTAAVGVDPKVVHTTPAYQDGLNLDALKQASTVGATTNWIDARGDISGGAPPEDVKGIAVVVNSGATRFEDEEYMVAAVRHEMVHVRLMRLTLQLRTEWKRSKAGEGFGAYVDRHLQGPDAALVKDRYFSGHRDETLAYLEGFLTAHGYSPVVAPGATEPSWVGHLQGFTKEYELARRNGGPMPKDRRRVPEDALAAREAANTVAAEAERILTDHCDALRDDQRANLAAWALHLRGKEGFHDAALDLIHRLATKRRPAAKGSTPPVSVPKAGR